MSFYRIVTKYICITVVSILILFLIFQKHATNDLLRDIPQEDQKILSDFFQELVTRHSFGYTLFDNEGLKPITTCDYFIHPSITDLMQEASDTSLLRKGERIWQKYKKKFASDTFILKTQTVGTVHSIVLINKQAVLLKVFENLSYFQEVLGDKTTPQDLLKALSNDDIPIEKALSYHSGLMGILYGYGTHNASLFHRFDVVCTILSRDVTALDKQNEEVENGFSKDVDFLINKKVLSITISEKEPLNLLKEHTYLDKKLSFSSCLFNDNPFSLVLIPTFRIDPDHRETLEIIKKYENLRKKLSPICKNPHFLEIFLKTLLGE